MLAARYGGGSGRQSCLVSLPRIPSVSALRSARYYPTVPFQRRFQAFIFRDIPSFCIWLRVRICPFTADTIRTFASGSLKVYLSLRELFSILSSRLCSGGNASGNCRTPWTVRPFFSVNNAFVIFSLFFWCKFYLLNFTAREIRVALSREMQAAKNETRHL